MADITQIQVGSTIYDIRDAKHGTYYVVGTQTEATGSWTGNLPDVEALYNGLTIDYWLPYAGDGNATLNLTLKDGTTTGAINCYYSGTTRLTTHIGVNNVCRLIYQTVTISGTNYTGWWLLKANDYNDTANKLHRGGGNLIADSIIYKCQMLFSIDETTVTPLNNVNNSTGTTKTMLTNIAFDPFGEIFYYDSTTTINADGNVGTAARWSANLDLRYTFNCGKTLTAHKPLYLKVLLQSDGNVKIADSLPITHDLPVTNDGILYIFLGRTYSTYQLYLYPVHHIYYHDGTGIKEYVRPHMHDDRYYTETEVDTLLSGKANTANLGTLASKDSVNYVTEVTNKPTLGTLAEKDQVAWSTDISGIPLTFPPETHNHDSRYYTETEVDTALSSKTNLSVIADEFSTSTTYAIDDLVIYQGVLYRFIAAHSAGDWNTNEVIVVNVAEELIANKISIQYNTQQKTLTILT